MSHPRTCILEPKKEGFGFKVFGDRPVIVKDVVEGGAAKKAGMLDGDVILSVCDVNVRTSSHGGVTLVDSA